MNKERLMRVLVQPHVSEKAAAATDKSNQYVFRVLDDATKGEVRQAVELMFEVKVRGREPAEPPGQDTPLQEHRRSSQWLQDSLRTAGGRPVDRFHRHAGEVRVKQWHSSK